MSALGEAVAALRQVFGYSEFRAGQQEAIEAQLDDCDVQVLLPTGGGKSLCYQIPALVRGAREEGVAVVVSPLIALMQDQVDTLHGRGVAAAALNSHQDERTSYETILSLRDGMLDLLYVSPERAMMPSFMRLLGDIDVSMLAIDEAHCISQWGHDFRPEYMRLAELRGIVDVPVIALTATATPRVMDEIAAGLALHYPQVIRGSFARPNLRFGVHHLGKDSDRLAALVDLLESCGLRERGSGRAIVYCATRKKTEMVAAALQRSGFSAGHYHAGRSEVARKRAQRAFDTRRTPILAATNAFGMGIDYPDVRCIVHFQTPGSVEAYYQEAGRAGRDGDPARCQLFFGRGDLVTQQRLLAGSATVAQRRRQGESLAEITAFAHASVCRQSIFIAHFTGQPANTACGVCDVCSDPSGVDQRPVRSAKKPATPAPALPEESNTIIVATVDQLRRPVGKMLLTKALRGSRAKALRRHGLLDLEHHGALGDYSEAQLLDAIEDLLREGRLARRGQKYPTVWIPNKPVRRASPGGPRKKRRPGPGPLERALLNYRQRTARRLKWKPYMVFHKRVVSAVAAQKPQSLSALEQIHGLGPAKIERFGPDILELVGRFGQP